MTVDEVIADVYEQLRTAPDRYARSGFFWIVGKEWLEAIGQRSGSRMTLAHGLLVGFPYTVVEGAGKPRLLPVDPEMPVTASIELALNVVLNLPAADMAEFGRRLTEALDPVLDVGKTRRGR